MGRSKVVVIKSPGALTSSGEIHAGKLKAMCARGLELLAGDSSSASGLAIALKPEDRVGVKVNTIGGPALSTRPETALAIARSLSETGVRPQNLVIWDRTNRELREAGYKLSIDRGGLRIFATDTAGAGYGRDLVSHLQIGSLLSTIQTDFATASVSLAILKDHGMAGITAGLKNYFGAIHNPNKYHDGGCDPYIAELFSLPEVRDKHRLSVIDALLVQYHRGPSFHPQWAARCDTLLFSTDPVAADRAGWAMIERLRAGKGLPSLKEEGREPRYILTAEKMGLGRASLETIDLVEDTV